MYSQTKSVASVDSCSEESFWTCIPESLRTFSSDEAANLGKNLKSKESQKEMESTKNNMVTRLLRDFPRFASTEFCFELALGSL